MKKIKEVTKRVAADSKVIVLGVALYVIYYTLVRLHFRAFCPMVIVTGFPCPGCGTTRAILCILMGQWRRAWNLNPTAFLWVIVAIWFGYRRYWCGKKVIWLKEMVIITVFVMIAVYIYRMLNYFPSYPPMTYGRKNILADIFPEYGEHILNFVDKLR